MREDGKDEEEILKQCESFLELFRYTNPEDFWKKVTGWNNHDILLEAFDQAVRSRCPAVSIPIGYESLYDSETKIFIRGCKEKWAESIKATPDRLYIALPSILGEVSPYYLPFMLEAKTPQYGGANFETIGLFRNWEREVPTLYMIHRTWEGHNDLRFVWSHQLKRNPDWFFAAEYDEKSHHNSSLYIEQVKKLFPDFKPSDIKIRMTPHPNSSGHIHLKVKESVVSHWMSEKEFFEQYIPIQK